MASKLAELTYREAEVFLSGGAYALLPCGATEAHGPHLPLNTDVIISEHGACCAADLLEKRGVTALVLPPVAYAVTDFASEFSGTLSISPAAAEGLLFEAARAAHVTGFLGVVFCNAHLEPDNIGAIRTAASRAEDAGLRAAFPDVTRKPHALRLGEEFKSGACHAGRYESSLVLAARPELVNMDIAKGLDENPSSLSVAIREGKNRFIEAGGPQAYFGAPAEATVEEGHALYEELADIFAGPIMAWELARKSP